METEENIRRVEEPESNFINVDEFVERVRGAKNQIVDEVVLLKDDKNGVLVQLNSNKMSVDELLSHATAGYNFVLESRKK